MSNGAVIGSTVSQQHSPLCITLWDTDPEGEIPAVSTPGSAIACPTADSNAASRTSSLILFLCLDSMARRFLVLPKALVSRSFFMKQSQRVEYYQAAATGPSMRCVRFLHSDNCYCQMNVHISLFLLEVQSPITQDLHVYVRHTIHVHDVHMLSYLYRCTGTFLCPHTPHRNMRNGCKILWFSKLGNV